jgi:hypothetical protein
MFLETYLQVVSKSRTVMKVDTAPPADSVRVGKWRVRRLFGVYLPGVAREPAGVFENVAALFTFNAPKDIRNFSSMLCFVGHFA